MKILSCGFQLAEKPVGAGGVYVCLVTREAGWMLFLSLQGEGRREMLSGVLLRLCYLDRVGSSPVWVLDLGRPVS